MKWPGGHALTAMRHAPRGSGGRRWAGRPWWRSRACVLWVWVVLHVAGNLTLFSGPAAADGYAAALRRTPGGALGGARRARRRGGRARRRRGLARARGPGGAAAAPGRRRRAHVRAGRADHAGGRRAAARLRRLPPAPPHGRASSTRAFVPGHVYDNVVRGLRPAWVAADLRRPPPRCSACTSSTASGRRRAASASGPTARHGGGVPRWPWSRPRWRWASRRCPWRCSRGGCDDAGARSARAPSGPLADALGAPPRRAGAGGPDAPPPALRPRGRRGAGRRLGGGHAVRAGLSRALPRLPRLAPPRPQRGRAGRDQRRQELPERRRQRRAALPRHAGGRRLPLARVQRVPAGRAVGAHHRPRGGPGRAVRARVRRPARQPLVRRRAGLADVLRARADRPAAPARRLSARSPRRRRRAASPCCRGGRCSTSSWWTAGRAASSRATCVSGALEAHLADAVVLATGGYANVYFLSTNAKASNATAIWRAHRRGAAFANPGFVQFHPTCLPAAGRAPGQAHPHVGVAAQRRPRSGCRAGRATTAGPRPSPRPSATTSSSAAIRATATSCPRDLGSRAAKAVCDEGRGVGPGGRGVYLDLREARAAAGRRRAARALRQPLRDVRAHHRRRSARRRRCASRRPRTTPWAGCGSTTTS